MSDVRVYLALGAPGLAVLAARGESDAAVTAVTATERRQRPDEDEETLEYEALWRAAGRCPGRPCVGAADVPAAWVLAQDAGGEPGVLALDRPVPRERVVSIHVALHVAGDEPDLDADGADRDDADRDDAELSWYDITEIAEVNALLAAAATQRGD